MTADEEPASFCEPALPAEGHTAWRGVSDGSDGSSVTVDCDHHDGVLYVAIWSSRGSTECSIPLDRTIGLLDLLIEAHGQTRGVLEQEALHEPCHTARCCSSASSWSSGRKLMVTRRRTAETLTPSSSTGKCAIGSLATGIRPSLKPCLVGETAERQSPCL